MATLQLSLNDKDLIDFRQAIDTNTVNKYIESVANNYIKTPVGLSVVKWDFVEGSTNLKIKVEVK